MKYDVFISYARRDDRPVAAGKGWITTIVDALREEHRRYSTVDLRFFFDTDAVGTMDDWRMRILESLRESTLLVVCLSPHYFRSRYCRWEWKTFTEHETDRGLDCEAIAPIYLRKVCGYSSGKMAAAVRAWARDLRRRQHLDFRPFVRANRRTLEEDARPSIAALDQQIANRLERIGRQLDAPGTVERHNAKFVGRKKELRKLRETVAHGRIGFVTAVHGLGGVGKSALATEYAHTYASEYTGGRWLLHCEHQSDLFTSLLQLVDPLGITLTEKESGATLAAARRVLQELHKRAVNKLGSRRSGESPRAAALLIFDNVDVPEFLSPSAVAKLPQGSWLHLLATTRLGPDALYSNSPDRTFLPLDELTLTDGISLLAQHQPNGAFRTTQERKSARTIVKILGGFTLAIEAVAVYLGTNPDVTCSAFLARLEAEGLGAPDALGADARVATSLRHREKTLSATLASTLQAVGEVEWLALEYATLLPVDQIALPWIRQIVAAKCAELAEPTTPGYPDRWTQAVRRLRGLRLVRSTAEGRVVRMHRLVQEFVRRRIEERDQPLANFAACSVVDGRSPEHFMAKIKQLRIAAVATLLISRARTLMEDYWKQEARWEIEPFAAVAAYWLQSERDGAGEIAIATYYVLRGVHRNEEAQNLIASGLKFASKRYGPSSNAHAVMRSVVGHFEGEGPLKEAIRTLERRCGKASPNVVNLRAEIAIKRADKSDVAAERHLRNALKILTTGNGRDSPLLLDPLHRLTSFLIRKGRAGEAVSAARESLRLARQNCPLGHPGVATSLGYLAEALSATGDIGAAEPLLREAIAIRIAVWGKDDPDLIKYRFMLKRILDDTGRADEAEVVFWQAMGVSLERGREILKKSRAPRGRRPTARQRDR